MLSKTKKRETLQDASTIYPIKLDIQIYLNGFHGDTKILNILKYADRMADSVDPDQSAPLGAV